MTDSVIRRKKLIEVALPLEAINVASAREKAIRRGHPSTLHLWWARRPLAAARAVIFSQMVDDPSEYVETLLSDPAKKRAATRELAKRRTAWSERSARYEEATRQSDQSVPAPGPEPTLEECVADIERERLFEIIRHLVLWENTTNETVLQSARDEIWQSWRRACAENAGHPRAKELFDRHKLPAFHDPFAGGGALPLEAQRLGLDSHASDLNPVAVLINKAMIEIPSKFSGKPPVNPISFKEKALPARQWSGVQGLSEDVRYYGRWMRDEAEKRIGHLYPKIEITAEMAQDRPDLKPLVGTKLTVIAWIWARTVKSPNPAYAEVDVPLASSFVLSARPGREVCIRPVVSGGSYHFTVSTGKQNLVHASRSGTKLSRGANFECVMSGTPITGDYIMAEGQAGRMGVRMMAVAAEGKHGRIYLPPTDEMEALAFTADPEWRPDVEFFRQALGFRVGNYGMTMWSDLFTSRQLAALTMFSDLVAEARELAARDALARGMADDNTPLFEGGLGAAAYADAVASYLGCGASKTANRANMLATWMPSVQCPGHLFRRHAIPMSWDFSEGNTLSGPSGSFWSMVDDTANALSFMSLSGAEGVVLQEDAASQTTSVGKVVSTDPPYYDNIGYADLSDFFYVWLRRSLRSVFPRLFATVAVPKAEELVATPHRHGGKAKADAFFLNGMTQAMSRLAEQAHPDYPTTIYYAFKQSETESDSGTASTGWETFLEAVFRAGFAITGTWPIRTERENRSRNQESNALASSIVLVCRPHEATAPAATRREFVEELRKQLPSALIHLQRGNIAPVDLAQAAIGPGMAVFTRFAKVMDAQGKPVAVREALALINQTLDEALADQEGDLDVDSRWALAWFDQMGFSSGEFGTADVLARAKNTSVAGLMEANVVVSGGGKVRLLPPAELAPDWHPVLDPRLTTWAAVHQLVRALEVSGERTAATLVAELGTKAETARELCYRLYTLCERKKRAAEALSYNGLVQSWPEITRLARESATERTVQPALL